MVAAAALLLSACSGQITNATAADPAQRNVVYPISAAQADQAIGESMQEVFPESPIVAVALPRKGYTVTISFLADSHRITAVAEPAKGRGADGTPIEGFAFTVSDYGSIPITATSRAQRLFAAINRRASTMAVPVPAVN